MFTFNSSSSSSSLLPFTIVLNLPPHRLDGSLFGQGSGWSVVVVPKQFAIQTVIKTRAEKQLKSSQRVPPLQITSSSFLHWSNNEQKQQQQKQWNEMKDVLTAWKAIVERQLRWPWSTTATEFDLASTSTEPRAKFSRLDTGYYFDCQLKRTKKKLLLNLQQSLWSISPLSLRCNLILAISGII